MQNASSGSQPLRFGAFELDLRSGELRKQGVRIKLQDQPFQILAMLLEHPGHVVTREDLRSRLWPSDTFVDFDHSLNKAINKLRDALGDSADKPRFIETLAKRGYRFLPDLNERSRGIRSLLVLPLENLSCDSGQDYFADGLTEALITRLARISALRVLSRTTAMHYKGTRKPLPEIARELQVDGVVEGTVLRSGERVRISAQLIHAPTDTHLWAESYEHDLQDVLRLQAEVAQAIVREVQVKLTPQEEAHFTEVRSIEPEAYETYLKGRYYWNGRSKDGHGKAVYNFRQAIAKDPTYAPAYAGLADSLSILGLWGLVPPDEGCGKAKELAQRAVAMDGALAEGHTSLAWSILHYDYDFSAAEREFQKSIELSPRYATTRQWYGMFLAILGRFEQGRAQLNHATRLDPCSSVIRWAKGFVEWRARRYDQAIRQYEEALELDASFAQAHWGLGIAFLENRMYERAIAQMQATRQISNDAPIAVVVHGEAFAAAGYPEMAQKILEELPDVSKHGYVMPYVVGRIHDALGKKDEALQWLENGFRDHAEWMVLLKTDARFGDVRSAPRFQSLLRRMKFPDY